MDNHWGPNLERHECGKDYRGGTTMGSGRRRQRAREQHAGKIGKGKGCPSKIEVVHMKGLIDKYRTLLGTNAKPWKIIKTMVFPQQS